MSRLAALPSPRHFLVVGPHAGAHRVALRAGLSVALPLLLLEASGRLDLSLYATFGAFTALYGRADRHGARGRMQLSAAAMLVTCVTLGTTVAVSPARAWLVVPVAALVAAAAASVSDLARWHPPGALFPVFALAACAAVPAAPARIPLAAAVAAASALLAVAIGVAGGARPRLDPRRRALRDVARRSDALHGRRGTPARPSAAPARAAAGRIDTRDVATAAVATLIAGLIPTALGLGHPYWAMVGALAAVSGPDTTARLVRAGHRATGTLLGVAAAAVLLALPLTPLETIAAVVALQCAAELLVGRNYALALIAVTPLALLMVELAHPVGSGALLHDRVLETLLGAAVGAVVTLAAHRGSDRDVATRTSLVTIR
jgi:hypothetical protein